MLVEDIQDVIEEKLMEFKNMNYLKNILYIVIQEL